MLEMTCKVVEQSAENDVVMEVTLMREDDDEEELAVFKEPLQA